MKPGFTVDSFVLLATLIGSIEAPRKVATRSDSHFWIRPTLVLAVIVFLAVDISAQAPSVERASDLAFEAASVKPSDFEGPGSFLPRTGSFSARNVSLRALILWAYRIHSFQLEGGPGWIDSARWAINAKAPASAPGVRFFPEMLQKLLEDRFALKIERQTRRRAVYKLRKLRSDGRLGRDITPFTGACRSVTDPQGELCRLNIQPSSIQATGTEWSAINLPGQLMATVGELIVDETGLAGRYSMKLQWTADLSIADDTVDRVSLYTALQEQLGLKLEREQGPVDVVLIRSVEHPTAD